MKDNRVFFTNDCENLIQRLPYLNKSSSSWSCFDQFFLTQTKFRTKKFLSNHISIWASQIKMFRQPDQIIFDWSILTQKSIITCGSLSKRLSSWRRFFCPIKPLLSEMQSFWHHFQREFQVSKQLTFIWEELNDQSDISRE